MLAAAACSSPTPSAPTASLGAAASAPAVTSSASVAGTDPLVVVMSTGSIAAPRPVSPAANLILRYVDQPVTLVVQNAVTTKVGGNTYTFEVAGDAGFAGIVQTKDGIAEGSGQTSVKLDALAGGKDYYWHARAQGNGTTGVYGPVFKFTVGPAIVINAPAPIAPLNGATTTPRPALRVTNAARSGPAGPITYKFEVSTSATFSSIVLSVITPEGINETGYIPTVNLPTGVALYWRATAMDATNGISSTPSAVQSFIAANPSQAEAIAAQLGVPLWPGAFPTGTLGHATMGEAGPFGVGWQIQTLYYAPGGVTFQSPDIEMLRFFDLFDRGFQPDDAVAWMNGNGYPTQALWYPPPEKAVLGLKYVYIAARGKVSVNGIWDIVVRVE
jgi:hypothetical protein